MLDAACRLPIEKDIYSTPHQIACRARRVSSAWRRRGREKGSTAVKSHAWPGICRAQAASGAWLNGGVGAVPVPAVPISPAHLKRIVPHPFSSSRCHPRQPALCEAFFSIFFASSPCPLTTNQRLQESRTPSLDAVPSPRIVSRHPASDKATVLLLPVDFLQARTSSRLQNSDNRLNKAI